VAIYTNEDNMKPMKPAQPKPPRTRPEPTPQMIARIAEARRRNAERLERPSIGLKLNEPKGGEQTVRVEHVHVYPGGQAIVGLVTKGGGSNENDRQTRETIDARALAFAPGDALLGEDPGRDAVPAGGCEGQEAVQAPWRS
jgi:hypothetical protein